MTDKQPTALRLAQQLVLDADDFEDNVADGVYAVGDAADCAAPRLREASMELLRLHEENERLQRIIDSRPPINAGLPQTYIEWSQSIYVMDYLHGTEDAQ